MDWDFSWFNDVLDEVGSAWNNVANSSAGQAVSSAWDTAKEYGGKAMDWMEQHPNVTSGIGAIAAPAIASALTPKQEPLRIDFPSAGQQQSQIQQAAAPQTNYVGGVSDASLQQASTPSSLADLPSAIPGRPTNKRKPTSMASAGSVTSY